MASTREFILGQHSLYNRYIKEWRLAYNSYIGSTEYKRARYLKAYKVDFEQPSETITTYDMASDGRYTNTYNTKLTPVNSSAEADAGYDAYEGSFYGEKLENTPLYPYVRLYVGAYNSLLFRNPPHREICQEDSPVYAAVEEFLKDVDGETNGINEFMSQVDIYTSIFGVCWVSVVKPEGNDTALFQAYTPIDVTNWKYAYSADGKLNLIDLVVNIGSGDGVSIFRRFTPTTITTFWVPTNDQVVPDIDSDLVQKDEGIYYVEQVNELGYIPVVPIYQGQKLYNGVGMTPIHDIAQIQRSIYGDTAEIYSAITYGAHPVNIVDQTTANLNEGKLGAEPGTVVIVPDSAVPGAAGNYVFEFRSPQLDSIEAIRNLINDKVAKMNEVAMVSSDEVMRQANSGVQLELYNDKLESFIKRKATSMENAELKLWTIWFDWLNAPLPEDLSVSYSKVYSKRGIEQEISELNALVDVYDKYTTLFGMATAPTNTTPAMTAQYPHIMVNPETGESRQAQDEAEHNTLMAQGFTEHPEQDRELTVESELADEADEIMEALKARFKSVLMKSYSENGK
jgi:hypothetical protein